MLEEKAIKLISEHLKEHNKIPLIVILGPTASGKTALSLKLSKKFNGEIISADSRQIYREMNIATDKISEEEREGIPHHLLDVAAPDENFTLAHYLKLAKKAIEDIYKRGKIPFLVGGTGLYINALTEAYLPPKVPPNAILREKYEKMAREKGSLFVYEILRGKNQKLAEKIHPNNLRYVIRALEILEAEKGDLLHQKKPSDYHVLKIGLNISRAKLYEKINNRVKEQIKNGILDELKGLLGKYSRTINSMSALGYKEYFDYLDGKIPLEKAVDLLQKRTRNYAKRQLTWFRKDKKIFWISPE